MITARTRAPRPAGPVQPLVALALVLLLAGVLAWIWLGDWRWAVTGTAVCLVGLLANGARTSTSTREAGRG
jgi:hypothetical protein